MLDEEKPGDSAPDRVNIKSINDAVVFFLDRLREANRLFVEGKDAGRSGAIAALVTVTDFLSLFPGTTDHQQPFGHIINALLSLDDGKVLPLLERRRRSGRHHDSAAREIDKAMVAITVNRLCNTGEKVAFVCREAGMGMHDAALEEIIEERRQQALLMIEKMREPQ